MSKTETSTILDKLEESKMKDIHFTQFARDLISKLKEKQQKVVLKRFGLSGRKRVTLDAIGKEFGVTRERVRQIEAASLAKLRKIAKLDHNITTFEKLRNIIKSKGGVIDEETMVRELIIDLNENRKEEIKKILRFILLLAEDIQTIQESDNLNKGWALSEYNKGMLEEIVDSFAEILETEQKVVADEIILEAILKNKVADKYKNQVSLKFYKSIMSVAKKIHKNEEGKIGLVHWPWVKPKTIRDKIFYVLSKKEEPMHFGEIAEEIKKRAFDNKKATVQTIHNELISDPRFVLVGRGLYGLKNWGYEGGTVEDVIEKILKKQGPLPQKDVVEEVMKKKKVKKATILINLHSSPRFKKTAEGYIAT